MKRLTLILVLFSTALMGQLPPYVIGAGAALDRSTGNQITADVTAAVLLKNTSFFWWSNIDTPLHRGVAGQPTPSTITTGGAWVAASTSRLSLVFIMMAGFSIADTQSSAAGITSVTPAFAGSIGVPIRIGTGPWAVMPYIKALATAATPTPTNGVSTIISPGLEVQYNFPNAVVIVAAGPAIKVATVKQMRAVMRRLKLDTGDLK